MGLLELFSVGFVPSGSFEEALLSFRYQLKPYQLIGLKWLLLLHEHKLSGILADEMVRPLSEADYFITLRSRTTMRNQIL